MAGHTRHPGELSPLPQPGRPPRRVETVPRIVGPAPVADGTPPPSAAPAEADPLLGLVIADRYRILERIGAGGMANVYRAEHQLLHKPVAVKLLLPELLAERDMAARFEREAIAAARLDHPNVVSITDFGQTPGGRLFLVMEYLEGTPLDELIDEEGHLPWDRAVELTRQLLRGLAHAHDVGVVHRDLKPSNVMVTAHAGGREVAKIIDFGIAKILDGAVQGPHVQTRGGIVFGTVDFLAPERLLGKGDADPRSDLYAAGVLLYEALTGARPFHDPDPSVVVKRALSEPARPPSALVPDVPPALDAIVLRALAKEPDDRYASARELLLALDPLARRAGSLGGVPATAAPGSPVPEPSVPPVATPSATPDRGLSSAAASPRPARRASWVVPLAIVLAVLVAVFLSSRTGPGIFPQAQTAAPAAAPTPDGQIDALVARAAQGDTVADRQSAFDRLVAFGYLDRVPWVPMLGQDLAQLPSCEARKEAVAKLEKVHDPAALPYLQEAAARPDNGCLVPDAQRAIAALLQAPAAGAPARKKPRSTGGGGGHF